MYTITQHKYGVVVTGPVPLAEITALWDELSAKGYDVIDELLSRHLQVTMVVTDLEGSEAWRAELGLADEAEQLQEQPDSGKIKAE